MLWIDALIIGLLAASALLGLLRGFVREFLSLVVWVAACGVAGYGSPDLSPYLQVITSPLIRQGVARGLLLLGIVAAGGVITSLLGQLLSRLGLSVTDRLLGFGFGVLRGGVIVCALLFFWDYCLAGSQHPVWQQSQLVPWGCRLLQWGLALFRQLSGELPRMMTLYNP